MNTYLLISCLLLSLAISVNSQSLCNKSVCAKLSKNGRCGPKFNNTICTYGTCSNWNWCGVGKDQKGVSYAGSRPFGTKYDYSPKNECCVIYKKCEKHFKHFLGFCLRVSCPEGEQLWKPKRICLGKNCPPGTSRKCVSIKRAKKTILKASTLPTLTCKKGYKKKFGICVKICEKGFKNVLNRCVKIECPEGKELYLLTCVKKCPAGFKRILTKCVRIQRAKKTMLKGGHVFKCKDGYKMILGVCVKKCEKHFKNVLNKCIRVSCPEGEKLWVPTQECLGKCPAGFKRILNRCVSIKRAKKTILKAKLTPFELLENMRMGPAVKVGKVSHNKTHLLVYVTSKKCKTC